MSKKTKKKIVEQKKNAVVQEEHEPYFVYLKNPVEYRRHLLESSRRTIHSLKNHQRILLLREKKSEAIAQLKTSIKELIYLNRKFNELLPKYDPSFLEGMKTKDKVKPIRVNISKAKAPPLPPKVERSELDRLEDSLANIEKKLKNL